MPRAAVAHGTYRAYLRCRVRPEGPCAACVAAKGDRSARNSKSAPARLQQKAADDAARAAAAKVTVPAMPTTDEGHVSRLEVLKEQLEASRETIARLKVTDPARVYLLMREQRETVREISEIQGNGQVKGVTLADQLEEARAARAARAAGA